MRALALLYPQRTLAEVEHPEPVLSGPRDVLYQTLEVGVCGTDRGLIEGRFGRPPAGEGHLVLGHEALGRVLQIGPDVQQFQPGDLVAPMIRRACFPNCSTCARARRDLCLTGNYTERGIIGAHGYFTELAVDHEMDLLPLSPLLRDVAVLMEPLSVVEKSLRNAFRAFDGEPARALVIGAGPIGILSALLLLHRGLEVIVHSLEPPSSPRARMLESYGASYCHTDPPVADLVVEAAGSTAAGFLAISKLRTAGVAVILGAPNGTGTLPFHDLIVGSRIVMGSVNADRDAFTQAAIDLTEIGPQKLQPLIERTAAANWSRTLLSDEPPPAPKWVHVW